MCGIAGEIRFDNQVASSENVKLMVKHLEKRGPDDNGIYGHDEYLFGHRRLSIIDLSDLGKQPMVDEKLGLTIVFNGCIYNHNQLRIELKKRGYEFISKSDTEVILKAYHAWGVNCVEHFNGMFAFVIREHRTKRTFMARDRLGIKPLYLLKTVNAVWFASTLPALLKIKTDAAQINPVALHNFMTFHSIVPAPHTIIQGIEKLPPATSLSIDASGYCTEIKYWEPTYIRDENVANCKNEKKLVEIVQRALEEAVDARLVADVEVGVLLSGGLDSSLIAGLLSKKLDHPIKTFSIGFEDVHGEKGNEFEYSDAIAKHFSTDHQRIPINSKTLVEFLPDCFEAMSEPMVSHDNIGFYLLSKYVAEHVKVVQSGQGADEIFGGYSWYPPLLHSYDPLKDYEKVFFDRDHTEYKRAINPAYINENYSKDFVAQHFDRPGADTSIDKAMRLDTTVMLTDDPVKRVDNMTMAWGLEARVPFLDHNLVEIAAQIPPNFKVKDGGKYVLKQVGRKVIPSNVIDRPKGYFPVPALKYLSGNSYMYVKDILNSQAAKERNIFKRTYLNKLLDQPTKHITPLQGSKLWQTATLEAWLQTHTV